MLSDNRIVAFFLIFFLLLMTFAGHIGLTVTGTIDKPEVSEENPGIISVLGYAWDGISFFFQMIAFQVDGIPAWLSTLFLVFFILIIWVFLKWIRGSAAGV